MFTFLLAYVGGVLTILSPCILPVLPFVFARADRPFVSHGLPMLVGMALSFAVVASLAAVGGGWVVSANQYGRFAAFTLLGLFGIALMFPALAERVARPVVSLGERLSGSTDAHGGSAPSMFSAVMLGIGTGLLWAPCAGPILGLILTGAAINGASVATSALLLAYAAGACTSLAVALASGRRIFALLQGSLAASERIRRVAGAAVLGGVLAIALGLDTGALSRLSYGSASQLESFLIEKIGAPSHVPRSDVSELDVMPQPRLMTADFREPVSSPRLPIEGSIASFGGATEWINSPPLTAAGLRGKVVLVDFWTYSCINCLRTLPYLRAWADKYRSEGLVVVGVHTPEFAFEKDMSNVQRATRDLHLDYPVAVDSNYGIWRAFDNHYWPALYFVDSRGRIRHHQFGEGSYDLSEKVIQQLLAEAGQPDVAPGLVSPQGQGTQALPSAVEPLSYETYLGYEHPSDFVSPDAVARDVAHVYRPATSLRLNQWTLSGNWVVQGEQVKLRQGSGVITYRFWARDLHLVLGPTSDGKPVRFRVLLDGKPPLGDHGFDVDAQGFGTADTHRLYQLVRQVTNDREHVFEIDFSEPGAEAFAFTFG